MPLKKRGRESFQRPCGDPTRLDRFSIFANSASLPLVDPIRADPFGETQDAAIATTTSRRIELRRLRSIENHRHLSLFGHDCRTRESVAYLASRMRKRDMSRTVRKGRTSLFRRLVYFAIVLISGGGAGGYAFQDHPVVQSLLNAVVGKSADGAAPTLDGTLVTDVVDALKPRDSFSQPGLYQVTVAKVELDQKLFKPGHTVDIQARVRKLDAGRPRSDDLGCQIVWIAAGRRGQGRAHRGMARPAVSGRVETRRSVRSRSV